ncbi:4-hydroxy-2-oxoheptanedioate aldolase [Brevibacterium sanguinis]|uniref:4-hydroxy-2-oxoheptanedioate aldolase n=2 Tax=Brevibacterium TaxID=1696 RepID=A0A366IH83_9MICO|nr:MULTISPECIES: aldolase/citrate lyase family protein [Brevibacterium]RBP64950.1 4-hydroxy-2-oxoheptanedioate aldolase [Brevibacterium sanguinis]RBP71213.1 4-hydroxy-2-oxoheptanedioate aldolase [Brevibacterium celere]
MTIPELAFFSQTGDPVILEIAARRGADFVVVDVQHGPYSRVNLRSQMQAIEAGGSRGFVRLSAVSGENVGAALDSGAHGLIAPLINSADDARDLVRFAKFPPVGVRSFGLSRQSDLTTLSIREVNDRLELFAMIETAQGLANVEEIAAVDGISGLYLGPTDLSIALGGTRYGDPSIVDAFDDAAARILTAARVGGKKAAFHGRTSTMIGPRLEQGFTTGVLASDLTLLATAIETNLEEMRTLEVGR